MNPLLIVIHTLLCVFLYAGQNFFNRFYTAAYEGEGETASAVFSIIYGVVIALVTLVLNGLRFAPSTLTVRLGLIEGVVVFFYNLFLIQASRRGSYAIISVLLPTSIILGTLLSAVFYWGDRLNALQLTGILVMFTAFFFLRGSSDSSTPTRRGYALFLLLLALVDAAYGIVLDAQSRLLPEERNELLVIAYTCCAVFSLLALLLRERKNTPQGLRMGRKAFLLALGSSVSAALAVYIWMILLQQVPSFIIYPIRCGMNLVLAELLCVWLLHEKLTKRLLIGITFAAASIVILNL